MDKEKLLKSIFAGSELRIFSPTEQDIYLAKASLEGIKEFLPKEVDLLVNSDLLGVAFNGCVINRANKNGDVIGTEDALAMLPTFLFKPFNLNHNRLNNVGVLTGYGFSEFGTNKALTLKDVKKMTEPFNIVFSGYVWKIVNKNFAALLESASDEDSEDYNRVSTSWEIGFRGWGIVKGSKNLNECQAVASEDLDKYSKYLKVCGGTGFDENDEPVYRLITSADGQPPLGLGFGFTENPAADVKGVLVAEAACNKKITNKAVIEAIKKCPESGMGYTNVSFKLKSGKIVSTNIFNGDEYNDDFEPDDIECLATEENFKNLQEKSSQTQKESVKDNITIMKKNIRFKSVNDINDEVLAEASAESVRDFISEQIAENSKKWEAEKAAKENEVKAANEKIEEANKAIETLKAESEKAKTDLEAIKKELDEVKAANEARERDVRFQARMSSLDNEYSLEDDARSIIVAEIKDLDDEAFAAWLKKFEVFAKEKKKPSKEEIEAKANAEKAEAEKKVQEAKANEEADKARILEDAEKQKLNLPNGTSAGSGGESLRERMSKAFSPEGFEISVKQ